jgi:hypothetical protein
MIEKVNEWLKTADEASVLYKKEEYKGYYDPSRVDEESAKKEGYHIYSLRESDDGDNPFASLCKGQCIVNHSGTFLTKQEIPMKENEMSISDDDDVKDDKMYFSH